MNKNMQIPKLLIPRFVIGNNCNIQGVFDFLQHFDNTNNQDEFTNITNDSYEFNQDYLPVAKWT